MTHLWNSLALIVVKIVFSQGKACLFNDLFIQVK